MTSEEYTTVLDRFLARHRMLIWHTSWMKPRSQVAVLIFLTREPWPVVHDAMYKRAIYKERFERLQEKK